MKTESNVIRSVRTAVKSSTAVMNDRKRDAGLRNISMWIVDVRNTELEESFNKELKELRSRIDGLSEHYQGKLSEINGDYK
ncbi:hypothetical protein [uncultured Alteromonas sp.]|uniref:hypothetical protein n=1 Tax=uncultured Alteromonas sp. TaxID=179113 RepID=UPI0030EE55E6